MPRLTIQLPERSRFSTEIPVRVDDINYGGHLGNDALVSLLHEARVRYLNAHGLSEGDCGGAGMVMVELAVTYLAEAFHGDTLRISMAIGDIGRTRVSFYYHVERTRDGTEIARARTGMAFFDFGSRRPRRTPEAFRAALGPS